MALTVEDGTGMSDADAFVSVADCTTYHTAQGNASWSDTPLADAETAIRRASSHLTNAYRWKGDKLNGRDQSLAWPRTGATDCDGTTLPSDAVPIEIINACCEIAILEQTTPGYMDPVYTPATGIKREKVDVLEVEYSGVDPGQAGDTRPKVSKVEDLIGCLLLSGSTSSVAYVGATARA